MGFWSAIKAVGRGEFRDAAAYAFVDEETIDAGNAADRKLDELNRQDLEHGAITSDEYRARLARITNNAFPDFINPDTGEHGQIFEQPGTDVVGGFEEGLVEGADNIRGTISKTVSGAVGLTWRLVPWQIWAAALIYVLFITSSWWLPRLAGRFVKKG